MASTGSYQYPPPLASTWRPLNNFFDPIHTISVSKSCELLSRLPQLCIDNSFLIIFKMETALMRLSPRCGALIFDIFYKKSSFLLPLAVVLGSLYGPNIKNVAPASVRCIHFLTFFDKKTCFYCPWQQKEGPVTNDLFAVTGFCGTKPICQRGFSISSNDVTLSPLIIY